MINVRAHNGLGDVWSDAAALVQRGPDLIHQVVLIMDQVGPYLGTIQHVLEDPALPAVVQRVEIIRGLEQSSSGGAAVKGVGLSKIVKPLDWYIWYRRNVPSWAPYAVGGLAAFLVLSSILKKGS